MKASASPSSSSDKSLLGIFRVPLLFAALILFGLLAALLGQQLFWYCLSWIALSIPVAAVVWCILKPRSPR
jgi:hypothetical protein